jgi:hypothetical protein
VTLTPILAIIATMKAPVNNSVKAGASVIRETLYYAGKLETAKGLNQWGVLGMIGIDIQRKIK